MGSRPICCRDIRVTVDAPASIELKVHCRGCRANLRANRTEDTHRFSIRADSHPKIHPIALDTATRRIAIAHWRGHIRTLRFSNRVQIVLLATVLDVEGSRRNELRRRIGWNADDEKQVC